MDHWIEKSAKWHWILIVLAMPFLLFPSPGRIIAILCLPVMWLLRWRVNRKPFPKTPLNLSILLISGMVLVSIWATYDLKVSYTKIIGVILGITIYFAIVDYGRKIKNWLLSWLLYGLAGIGIAMIGFAGTAWPSGKFIFLDRISAEMTTVLRGLPGAPEGFHPNEIAGALLWVIPAMIVSVYYIITEHDVHLAMVLPGCIRKPYWILGIKIILSFWAWFCLGVFIMTQSRGGYLGLITSLIFAGWLGLKTRWKLVSLGIITFAIVIMIFRGSDIFKRSLFTQSVMDDPALSINTLEGRVEIWSRAIYGIQDFPFTGMGMNTFRQVVHVLYPLFLISPESDIGHAHNELLQAGLDLGIPGMIAFLAINLSAFWMVIDLWQNKVKLDESMDARLVRGIVLGCGASLFAHFIYGITDAVAIGAKPGFIFWILIGLITSLYLLEKSRSKNLQ